MAAAVCVVRCPVLLRVKSRCLACLWSSSSLSVESREPACSPELQSPSLVALTFLGMYSWWAVFLAAPHPTPCSDHRVMLQAAMY